MNRRTFLTGLLASTAAVPIARTASLAQDTFMVIGESGGSLFRAEAGGVYTLVYWSEVAPISFSGFEVIPYRRPPLCKLDDTFWEEDE